MLFIHSGTKYKMHSRQRIRNWQRHRSKKTRASGRTALRTVEWKAVWWARGISSRSDLEKPCQAQIYMLHCKGPYQIWEWSLEVKVKRMSQLWGREIRKRLMQRRCGVSKTAGSEDRRRKRLKSPLQIFILIVIVLASKAYASSNPTGLNSLPSWLLTLLSANVHAESWKAFIHWGSCWCWKP